VDGARAFHGHGDKATQSSSGEAEQRYEPLGVKALAAGGAVIAHGGKQPDQRKKEIENGCAMGAAHVSAIAGGALAGGAADPFG
jgi:hypothetical protein